MPSAKVRAPTGIIIYSWTSVAHPACAPPFIMFIIGSGSDGLLVPVIFAIYCHNGKPSELACALATANDTDRIALAPKLDLLSVPSRSNITWSTPCWSAASWPISDGAIRSLTLATACETPLPIKRSPPSRSSSASAAPVEAPLGTAARPNEPSSSSTSVSTVGLPRESRIQRAWIFLIFAINFLLNY